MAVDFVGIHTVNHLNRIFQLTNHHDFSVSSDFKRSGHARFRRGPPSDPQTPSRSEEKVFLNNNNNPPTTASNDGCLKQPVTDTTTSTASSFSFSLAGGSVSNGRQVSSLGVVAPTPSFSSRKPPLPSSHRKRLGADINHSLSANGCHCCKRRKTGSKRKVRRIPITGSKVESIPADDYSWKKYGEKKVTGSPFPRVYYKCNSAEGCPARKSVELSLTDSKMLIVTYDREHRH